jgi:2-keto-4-pentenoate hydratase/2-oxohepta-3-ene-1,7-dioic acid hydratase in catechol pathway
MCRTSLNGMFHDFIFAYMKIICIGRNYVAHAKELGNEVPKSPVIFLKPDTALLRKKEVFFIPDFSNDVHYECEIVIRINRIGKNIETQFAHKYFDSISVGIDFTARDVQSELKEKGLPWEKAKGFDRAAVVGEWKKADQYQMNNTSFTMTKNQETVQSGNTSMMIHSIHKIIHEVSKYFTLKIGDLIYTGTPEGVGKVNSGDILEGFLEGESVFKVKVK